MSITSTKYPTQGRIRATARVYDLALLDGVAVGSTVVFDELIPANRTSTILLPTLGSYIHDITLPSGGVWIVTRNGSQAAVDENTVQQALVEIFLTSVATIPYQDGYHMPIVLPSTDVITVQLSMQFSTGQYGPVYGESAAYLCTFTGGTVPSSSPAVFKFAYSYSQGTSYDAGDLITFNGSIYASTINANMQDPANAAGGEWSLQFENFGSGIPYYDYANSLETFAIAYDGIRQPVPMQRKPYGWTQVYGDYLQILNAEKYQYFPVVGWVRCSDDFTQVLAPNIQTGQLVKWTGDAYTACSAMTIYGSSPQMAFVVRTDPGGLATLQVSGVLAESVYSGYKLTPAQGVPMYLSTASTSPSTAVFNLVPTPPTSPGTCTVCVGVMYQHFHIASQPFEIQVNA